MLVLHRSPLKIDLSAILVCYVLCYASLCACVRVCVMLCLCGVGEMGFRMFYSIKNIDNLLARAA